MIETAEPKPELTLDRDPSPEGEAGEFSTTDEKADLRDKKHELAVLKQEQGLIGRLIGCTESSLTIAFTLLILGFLGILVLIVGTFFDPTAFDGVIEKLITFELTVAGYVMGKNSG